MVSRTEGALSVVRLVDGFVVAQLQIPSTSTFQKPFVHHLYIRLNAPKVPTADTPRQIFAVNVPIDATEEHFRTLFAQSLGGVRVESVAFEGARIRRGTTAPVAPAKSKKRKRQGDGENGEESGSQDVGSLPDIWDRALHPSGSSALITMVDKTSADLAMKDARKLAKQGRQIPWTAGPQTRLPTLGSERYLTHHRLRFPDHAELQQSVDLFMEAFTSQEAIRAKLLAKQRSVPDEDGFITVTRGGRNGPAREQDTRIQEEELKRRDKNRVKDDFYRFQTREKKKEIAKDLVRAFEEDAKKIEAMRKKRNKFRPE